MKEANASSGVRRESSFHCCFSWCDRHLRSSSAGLVQELRRDRSGYVSDVPSTRWTTRILPALSSARSTSAARILLAGTRTCFSPSSTPRDISGASASRECHAGGACGGDGRRGQCRNYRGYISGTINFGGANVDRDGSRHVFLAIFNFDGNQSCSARYGDVSAIRMGHSTSLWNASGMCHDRPVPGIDRFRRRCADQRRRATTSSWRASVGRELPVRPALWRRRGRRRQFGLVDAGFNAYITGIVATSADFGGGAW